MFGYVNYSPQGVWVSTATEGTKGKLLVLKDGTKCMSTKVQAKEVLTVMEEWSTSVD